MKNLFDSRGKARDFAARNGGKVKDRGAFFDKERWAVEGAEVSASHGEKVTVECKSRTEARDLALKHNGKIIDRVKIKSLWGYGKKPNRWAVEYVEQIVEAPDADKAIYKSIASDYNAKAYPTTKQHLALEEPRCVPITFEIVDVPPPAEKEPVVIMTLKNISVTLNDGTTLVMSRDNDDFKACVALFVDGDVDGMVELMSVDRKPREWKFGEDICVIGGKLYHFGMVVDNTSIARRIINDCEAGLDPFKYVNFFRKLMQNPSYKAVRHTYDFIQHNDLEILDNGDIRAWKKVSNSGHANKGVPNFKGMTIMMPRNQVEDDPNITCSHGLHVAAKEYFKHEFKNGLLIEVAVSPADIVSVPKDYNNSKCRSCRYEVLTGLERPAGVPQVLIIDKDGNKLEEINTDE